MTEKYIEIEHPGIMLKEDFLDDMGIKPGTLAKAIGVDRTAIKKIIEGKRAITADTAMRLGRLFGMSPQTWMNLQAQYDLEIAEHELGDKIDHEVMPLAA